MYAVSGTITRTDGRWVKTWQIPTFYLHENVQGIVSEDHAVRVARNVVDVFGIFPEDRVSLHAVKMDVS
jgi:hypothetical protein